MVIETIGCYELNKVYCEDCLEGIKKLPNDSINLVITDPPYGDNIGYGRMITDKDRIEELEKDWHDGEKDTVEDEE